MLSGSFSVLPRAAVIMLLLSCAAPPFESATPVEPRPRATTGSELQPSLQPIDAETVEQQAFVGKGELSQLEVSGFGPAVFFVPPGREARPLVIAAHGAGGTPEWECEYWRRLTKDRAFVLSLRGTPLGTYPGYFYRDHRALEKELIEAEHAARAFSPRILQGSGLYVGFSQGATMGSAMINAHVDAFPYLVLVEGFDQWNVPRAQAFARNGGQRILIACGSKECAKAGEVSLRWLTKANVQGRLEYAPGEGHTPMGGVQSRIQASLPWLLADAPAWQ
jgi:predicted esterase